MTEHPVADPGFVTVDGLRRELLLHTKAFDDKRNADKELFEVNIRAERELRAEMFVASKRDREHLSDRLDRQVVDIGQLRSRMDQGEGAQSKAQTVQTLIFSILGTLLLAVSVAAAVYSSTRQVAAVVK